MMALWKGKHPRDSSLGQVRRAYSFWGHHLRFYAFLCGLISLGHRKEESLRRRAVTQLAALQGGRILEIACGTGRDLPYLQQIVGARAPLFAVDYTPEMLDVARQSATRRGWRNLHFIRGDAAALPFHDGGFDGVLCVFGMSAVPGYPACLHEAMRVTKFGGRVVICDGRPFRGGWRWVNPLITDFLWRTACWAYDRDIVSDLRTLESGLIVEEFNTGTLFIATLTRKAECAIYERVIPLRTTTGR